MNSPNEAERLLAYLAGELPETEAAALEARLKVEPLLAEQFIALARDEAVLAEWANLNGRPPLRKADDQRPISFPRRRSSLHVLQPWSFVLALAACLLLAVGAIYFVQPNPPTPPGPIAVLEDVGGEVLLIADGESSPIEKGQQLFQGAELHTVGEGSFAVVRYPDEARLELSADTTARLEGSAAKTKGQLQSRRVYAPEGRLTAEVTRMPMVLATPHAEVRSAVGSFICSIVSASTCIEPEKGRVEVTRSGQPMVEVETGFYTVANDASVSKPRLRPAPVMLPQATLTDGVGPIPCLVATPDGRTLLSGGNDGLVRFWDTGTQQLRSTIKAHQGPVRVLALAPDGQTFATAGSDRFVHLWNITTGEELYTLRKQRTEVECLAFSPDGRTLAAGSVAAKDGIELRLYDVPTGLECGSLHTTVPRGAVAAVAFSSDGQTLATGGKDGVVHLWELSENPLWSTLRSPSDDRFTLKERCVFQAHSLDVRSLAFSPNGQLLATGGREGAACVWQTADCTRLFTLTEHGRDVRSVAFSLDGTLLATAGGDGTARVWQASDGQEYAIYRAHKGTAMRALFSLDGATLETCGADKLIKFWKLQPPPIAPGL